MVSIPHRFNSHLYNIASDYVINNGFNPSQVQFTRSCFEPVDESVSGFQSLTGSIHTEDISTLLGPFILSFNPSQVQFTLQDDFDEFFILKKFQSLTGSIHTYTGCFISGYWHTVSIPHRFNSHVSSLPAGSGDK